MTIKQKFLWKEGEIRLYSQPYDISEEQYRRADKALDEIISSVKEKRYTSSVIRPRWRIYYRTRRLHLVKRPVRCIEV
jgi:hypothetical protein